MVSPLVESASLEPPQVYPLIVIKLLRVGLLSVFVRTKHGRGPRIIPHIVPHSGSTSKVV